MLKILGGIIIIIGIFYILIQPTIEDLKYDIKEQETVFIITDIILLTIFIYPILAIMEEMFN